VVVSRSLAIFGSVRAALGRHVILLWTVLVLLGLGLFAHQQRHEAGELAATFASAAPGWLLVLVAFQLAGIGCSVLVYRGVLKRLGHCVCPGRLALIHLQRHVVSVLTPIGGPASAYVFVRGLASHQVSTNDSLLTLALRGVSGYAAFVTLLIPALLLTTPSTLMLVAAVMLALLLVVALVALFVVMRGDASSEHLPGWLPERAAGFVVQCRSHALGPRDLVYPYVVALQLNLCGVAMLYASLQALGQQVSPATALAAFAVGNLFAIVAPVFQGVGVVEVSMAVTLQGFGVPGSIALGATLLYRVADVWFPLALGLLAQAGQHPPVRRTGSRLAGLTAGAGIVFLSWYAALAGAGLRDYQVALLTLLAGTGCLLMAYAPWRRLLVARYTTAGIALSAVPVIFDGQLDHLALLMTQAGMALSVLIR
jgi:uncharacterized membrane protein YbhN (UPF0104 family)